LAEEEDVATQVEDLRALRDLQVRLCRRTESGQILDDLHPTKAVENVAVLVLNGDETVERTLTNRFGEFQLEPDPAETLRICVGVPEIGSVSVPWPMAGTKAPGNAGQEGARKPGRKMKARQP